MKNFTYGLFLLAVTVFFAGNAQGQAVVDLTGSANANILTDTLPDVPAGAVVLLKPGMTYNAGYAFDKAVTLQSSEPFNLNLPKIDCTSNFNFADGAKADSIIFKNLEFVGEYDARYVLNSNVGATIGEIRFDGCLIHELRGVLRMKDAGPGTLEKLTFDNCVITRIRDYGVLTVDRNDWVCNNILFKNSTITKTRTFITNKNNSKSVVIQNCSLNEVTAGGQRMFRWREAGQDNVTGGIQVKNTLWGPGWDEDGAGTAIDGFDGLATTTWNFENTWSTNDVNFAAGKDTIKGLFTWNYGGKATDLWAAPATGNLNFKDKGFKARGFAGDPRWSVLTADGGLEWNISDSAYFSLVELDMTKTVAGLTVFANSGKKVAFDPNGKTVDDMTFTHRLKLGGSGDFDEKGQPKGRVLSIDVAGNTNITVAAMSSSSGEDRTLNIAAGGKDNIVAAFPALGPTLTKATYFYKGGPTKLYFYSPSSGVNVYYLKAASVPTSVNEIAFEKAEVNVYPNPATDKIYVDYKKPIEVAVYNIAGVRIKTKLVQSVADYISVSDLQSGVYLIRSANDNTFVRKFIKQ